MTINKRNISFKPNTLNVKSIFLRTVASFYSRKIVYALDNTITYGVKDFEHTSVKCIHCNLYNSFSFNTKQTSCIRCNKKLIIDDITAAISYKETLSNRDFKKINDWNSESSVILGDNNV